ncbi:MAG: Co2+/Mg2+ efflux protein ApaG [Chitinophagales bacterium]|nr:Co2+/Mg2+ efflux protein ApaG [Chitinophagales bacterium]
MNISILTTKGITVMVETAYLPLHSDPRAERFVFAYYITIENGSNQTVQLLRRHWFITDGAGQVREVEGEGVIGEKPVLTPGASHSYQSYCELDTDIGKMQGNYTMQQQADRELFEVVIPEFVLTVPARLN